MMSSTPSTFQATIGHLGVLFVSVLFCILSTLIFYIVDLNVVSLVYFIIILGVTFYITLIVYTKWKDDINMSITQGLAIILGYNLLNFFYLGYILERHTNLVTISSDNVLGVTEYGIFVMWSVVAFVILPLVFICYVIYINYAKTSSDEKTLQMITSLEYQLGKLKEARVEQNTANVPDANNFEFVQRDEQPLHPPSIFEPPVSPQYKLQNVEVVSVFPTLDMNTIDYKSLIHYNPQHADSEETVYKN
jgi:hypothetical protein